MRGGSKSEDSSLRRVHAGIITGTLLAKTAEHDRAAVAAVERVRKTCFVSGRHLSRAKNTPIHPGFAPASLIFLLPAELPIYHSPTSSKGIKARASARRANL
jgi:hypothetical protein